jgi:hypothetical protein
MWLMLAWPCLAAACSDDDVTSTSTPTGTGGGQGGSGGSGGSGAGGDGGQIIPDTECVDPGAAGLDVYDDGAAPAVGQLARVGARFHASGPDGRVAFDDDGDNADASPLPLGASFNVIVAEGATVGMAASGSLVQFQRFDEDGAGASALAGVASEAAVALALAATPDRTFVTWAFNTKLRGRALDENGIFVGDAFDLTSAAYSTFASIRAVARAGRYGVVWTGDADLGAQTSFFVEASATAPAGDRIDLYRSVGAHTVADVVATDDGYVVLLTGEPPENRPLVLVLDEDGTPRGEPRVLEGASYAIGVASRGDEVAVLAGRASGEPQMRAFDLELAPLAPWVCLGDDLDLASPGAIAVDGAGYATLHRTAAGGAVLHRLDHLGTGAP